METREVKRLEEKIMALRHSLRELSDSADFDELLKIIHRPGWTTPAEALLVAGVVDSAEAQVKALRELKRVLLSGSQLVGTPVVRS